MAGVTYDPDRHHRRSIRMPGYDYAQAGLYFVTICVQDRAFLFGEVVDGLMAPNIAGLMVESWWCSLTWRFPAIDVDAYVVMPNHFHGIVVIGTGGEPEPGTIDDPMNVIAPRTTNGPFTPSDQGGHGGPPLHGTLHCQHCVGADLRVRPVPNADSADDGAEFTQPPSLSKLMQWFKSITTKDYTVGVINHDWPPFNRGLWQRNYYEHIIRNNHELDRARRYIEGNPSRWAEDPENPVTLSPR